MVYGIWSDWFDGPVTPAQTNLSYCWHSFWSWPRVELLLAYNEHYKKKLTLFPDFFTVVMED